MTTKTYVDYTTPAVDAAWLNDVDRLLYDILGNPADDAAVLTGLGVTATAAELNILDGVTATAAELNVLDGITPTVTELNYVDGVTSAIQTQLDAKAALSGSALQAFAGSNIAISLFAHMSAAQKADWIAQTFTLDMTSVIQAAHTAAIAAGYQAVEFPPGGGLFTTLTWSPHVQARAGGKVYLRTANASGRTIQISDEYGRPSLYGLNSPRNTVFDGQFYVVNTNSGNTATAWSFGGSSASYYCNLATILRGVETRTFHGGLYEFRYNTFLVDIVDCFDYGCNGPRIKIADPVTNTGEGIRFINTVFGTGASYLMDVNTVHLMSFDFIGCSADYLLGLNTTGKSAPLVSVNWHGGHLEWDTVAAAYLQNDAAMTWNIDGATVAPTAVSGWPTNVISVTTGAGTTRFTNIKYVLPGTLNTLHNYVSATSVGTLDYVPNVQGGNGYTTFVNFHADSLINYDGVTMREFFGDTPTWSGTIGNGTLKRTYQRIGRHITVSFTVIWGSTTTHPASVQSFGLPYLSSASGGGEGSWLVKDNSATLYYAGTAHIGSSSTNAQSNFLNGGAASISDAIPMTWAVGDELYMTINYFID